MAKGGGNKKIFQYCTDPSGQESLCLRAFQGHSRRNLMDPSLQDNVLIPNDFFKYIHHIGCAINLHSLMNSGLNLGGQILSKRQTVFFTSVDPMNKEHRDLDVIDLEAPRLAWYKQKTWTKHQEALLYVFEDNEAAIKMITKGRSPTMRHVSRAHRVALDWLFGRESSFCLTDGHMSFEECRIGGKAPKIQKSSCTPRR